MIGTDVGLVVGSRSVAVAREGGRVMNVRYGLAFFLGCTLRFIP